MAEATVNGAARVEEEVLPPDAVVTTFGGVHNALVSIASPGVQAGSRG